MVVCGVCVITKTKHSIPSGVCVIKITIIVTFLFLNLHLCSNTLIKVFIVFLVTWLVNLVTSLSGFLPSCELCETSHRAPPDARNSLALVRWPTSQERKYKVGRKYLLLPVYCVRMLFFPLEIIHFYITRSKAMAGKGSPCPHTQPS